MSLTQVGYSELGEVHAKTYSSQISPLEVDINDSDDDYNDNNMIDVVMGEEKSDKTHEAVQNRTKQKCSTCHLSVNRCKPLGHQLSTFECVHSSYPSQIKEILQKRLQQQQQQKKNNISNDIYHT